MDEGTPVPGGQAKNLSNLLAAGELIDAGLYDQLADILTSAQKSSNQIGDSISIEIVDAAYQICRACQQFNTERKQHQRACEEASQREQALQEKLHAIINLIIRDDLNHYGERDQTVHTDIKFKIETPEPEKQSSIWQRLRNAIALLVNAQPQPTYPSEFSITALDVSPSTAQELPGSPAGVQSTPLSLIKPDAVPSPIRDAAVPEDQTRPSMEIYCLGTFRILQGERWIETWSSRKALLVFKYLLVNRQKFVSRDILMDTFWRDSDPEAARRNLHQAIYALRQTLKTNSTTIQHIVFENDAYGLNPELTIWVDFEEFKQRVHHAQQLVNENLLDEAVDEYVIAESLYQGEFMAEDIYEDWLQVQRQDLFQRYINAASFLTKYHLGRNEFSSASALCQRILSMDYSQEKAHRNLMRCYFHMGQRNLAIRQYQLCTKALEDELGMLPSKETRTLYQELLQSAKSPTH